jgi:hypothetical protein
VGRVVLAFEVGLIGDQKTGDLIVGVGLGFVEPLGDVVEALAVGEVVDEDDADGSAVVAAGDGLESFLAGLRGGGGTVSQICSLTGRSPMVTILDPNSTPMVVSWSNLNFFSRNWSNMQLFPTPEWKQRYSYRRSRSA